MCAHRTLIKTQDYLDVFARFKNTENITAVERVLGAHPQLEPFEKSQLGMIPHARTHSFPPSLPPSFFPLVPPFLHNFRREDRDRVDGFPSGVRHTASLCCESAEEAKTLIPSLTNKITDVDLQEILDDITKLRTFVD